MKFIFSLFLISWTNDKRFDLDLLCFGSFADDCYWCLDDNQIPGAVFFSSQANNKCLHFDVIAFWMGQEWEEAKEKITKRADATMMVETARITKWWW